MLGKTSFTVYQNEIAITSDKLIPLSIEYEFIKTIEKVTDTNLKDVATLLWGTSATGYGKLKISIEEYNKLILSDKKRYCP
jgi:hypothetical protein